MQHTLGKQERLGRKEFRRAQWRKCGYTRHFLLFQSRNNSAGKRIGVVIQRKIKGAVVRNRIRRTVKEFFRLNKDLFRDNHDYSVRVIVKPERIHWNLISTELRSLVAGTFRQ